MKTTSPTKVLIVDDEKKACTNLKHLLLEYADEDLDIAGVAYSTKEAESLISTTEPDAIFLDIEMPKENAFHFLERIAPFDFEVIFVTSYNEYAVKAFKLNAIDYILKPISINELKNAVNKLAEKLKYKRVIANTVSYTDISDELSNKKKLSRIVLKNINSTEIVDFDQIQYIEAQGSYSRIVFLKNNHVSDVIMSNPLSEYEELLPVDLFCRIHRSYLVNSLYISHIQKSNSYNVQLKDKTLLPVSRRRFNTLVEYLKKSPYYNE